MLYAVLRPLTLALLRIAFRFRTMGVQNIPAEGPVLLASNHVSFLDPAAIGAAASRRLHFMAKVELFRVPVLGAVIRRLNAHPVVREGSDASALRLALGLLRDGRALLVFPEGTRGTEGSLRPGRAGAGMLAALAEVPVVPVYVQGTGHALPRGAILPRPARITVAYGPPLRFARGRGKARYQAISDEIMTAIGRLRAEVEQRPHPEAAPPATSNRTDRTARGALPAGHIQ